MRALPALVLLLACSDYGLNDNKEDNPGDPGFDSGGAPDSEPPEDSEPPDSVPPDDSAEPGDSELPDPLCEDESWPGQRLSLTPDCEEPLPLGGFNPTLKWHVSSFTTNPNNDTVIMTPALGQLSDDNGDGRVDASDGPDLVVVTTAAGPAVMRALDGATGAELWTVSSAGLQSGGHLALGDIDGDGLLEILGVGRGSELIAFENDGSLKWTSVALGASISTNGDAPSIADMDGDGVAEITAGRAILNADGSLRGQGVSCQAEGFGGTNSVPVDLDGDGQLELITGCAAYDADANLLWDNGEEDGGVAVADFDLDGMGEIAVVTYSEVRLQDTDGSVLWAIPHDTTGPEGLTGAAPTVADVDGDGWPELLVTTRGSLVAYTVSGARLWAAPIFDQSSASVGCTAFDFEGDGRLEVVIADQTALRVLDGPTGAELWSDSRHRSNTLSEYAIVADVDGDGHAEIAVGNNGTALGLMVFEDAQDSWMPAPTLWAMHGEAFTNLLSDGSVLTSPPPAWPQRNSFRVPPLSLAGEDVRLLPNATARLESLCEIECEAGDRAVLYARVGNGGAVALDGPITLALLGRTEAGELRLDERVYSTPLEARVLQDGVRFEVSGVSALGLTDLGLRVEGAAEDCELSDDEVWLERAPCGG